MELSNSASPPAKPGDFLVINDPLTTQKYDAPVGGIQQADSRSIEPNATRPDSAPREPKV